MQGLGVDVLSMPAQAGGAAGSTLMTFLPVALLHAKVQQDPRGQQGLSVRVSVLFRWFRHGHVLHACACHSV